MGVDQSTSEKDLSDSSADQENNNNVGRKRRKLEEDGGSSLSLESIITFFTVGSVILLLIIIGLFIFRNFGLFSEAGGGNEGGSEHEQTRDELENKVKGEVQFRTNEEGPLSSKKKRKDMKKKLNGLVEEIKNLQSFRNQDKTKLNQLQTQIVTIIDFVETVDQKNGNVSKTKRNEVKQAQEQMENLRKKLIDSYKENQHPKVADKLGTLNMDVVWTVGGELDKILNKSQ